MNCDLWRFLAESLLVGRNFVSGICELKLKQEKPKKNEILYKKNLCFYQPWWELNPVLVVEISAP